MEQHITLISSLFMKSILKYITECSINLILTQEMGLLMANYMIRVIKTGPTLGPHWMCAFRNACIVCALRVPPFVNAHRLHFRSAACFGSAAQQES